ncbi:MAG TPA: SRPBCC domain-containing protein [Chitinophagaceae bacterium]|nr:SRPBCC domain-containing protein [Chitinophagaceae bacterium]
MSDSSKLEIKTQLKIQKPLHDVFEAIVDPAQMSNYFIAKSTGRMEQGKTLTWQFPEFDMKFPVRVDKVEKEKYVSFYWGNPEDKTETRVEISLQQMSDGVFVTVTEGNKERNDAGIKWLAGNTAGWANFLACLKAWLEYGINLRKGAFDMSQMPKEAVV